ncbi:hypothetical protein KKI23_03315 [Patescibacteria group bacterium]|nr:hypothetical protein [Patescibacteria group bacterium]
MKKVIIGLIVIAVLGLGAFFILKSPESSDWKTYENTRYIFSVDYPGNWDLREAPTNNDGREFDSPDGDIACRTYGFNNSLLNDRGEPQTLSEFVDWLTENPEIEEVLERNNTTMAGKEAQELVTLDNGITVRAVYVLGVETGRGLVCSYPNKEIMDKQNENFVTMKQSFSINTSLDGV